MHLSKQLRLFWENSDIRIERIRLVNIEPAQPLQYDQLPANTFVFLFQGKAHVDWGSNVCTAERFFTLHVSASNKLHIHAERRQCRCYLVSYTPLLEPNPALTLHSYMLFPQQPLVILDLLDRMYEMDGGITVHTLMQQTIIKGQFFLIIQQLLEQLDNGALPDRSGDNISEVLQYIEMHYLEEITLDLLANVVESSPRHLARQFKERMGVSPIDYVIQMRMKQARHLLVHSDASLQEIAEQIGYTDSYAFSKMFKKQYGLPPIGYRSQYRAEQVTPTHSASIHKSIVPERTVQTHLGNVRVPLQPKRVAALYIMGDVLHCGIKPVAISDLYPGCVFDHMLAGIPQIGPWYAPDLQALRAADPDLIIVPSETLYHRVKHIAPTVCVGTAHHPSKQLELINTVLGQSLDVWGSIQHLERLAADCSAQLAKAGMLHHTVTIVEGGLRHLSVMCDKWVGRGSHIVYHYLGLKAPALIQNRLDHSGSSSSITVALDQMAPLVGDILIRSSYPGMDDLSLSTDWRNLPAVSRGHIIELDFGLLYYPDRLSLEQQLLRITKQLLTLKAGM